MMHFCFGINQNVNIVSFAYFASTSMTNAVVRLRQGYGGTAFNGCFASVFPSYQSPRCSRDGLPSRKKKPSENLTACWRLVEVCNLAANFALKDFYAQTIENFVVAIPDLIESNRTAEKVSGKQKSLKCKAEDFPWYFSEYCVSLTQILSLLPVILIKINKIAAMRWRLLMLPQFNKFI